ncbi:acyltransferase family protein [Xinfangfangia sp. CPCC 101601]|uniref:Acyltransferase family protein n=1 Tax=Pseudogemmobacter lacusdianii TaxID=3069608 RepID=A0ABU0VV14_9RHOB|nr:acyltransferase family protein [Xinfangfangia sp. CPCC 101601]MDQ2065523.1 acyltransferase family protein [Xinfangfangia sp. CPCC 101601]
MASLFLYNEETPTPSTFTLLPVVGTMLVLGFGQTQGMSGRLLTWMPLRLIGLASYSIYLWHQPILSYARLSGWMAEGSFLSAVFWVAVILGVGFASWVFVEQRYRRKAGIIPRLLLIQGALLALTLTLGMSRAPYLFVSNENRDLLSAEWRQARNYVRTGVKPYKDRAFSDDGRPKIQIIGDSYGMDFVNSMIEYGVIDQIDLSVHIISWNCGNLAVPRDDPALLAQDLPAKCDDIDRYEGAPLLGRMQSADRVVLISYWDDWHLPFMQASLKRVRELTANDLLLVGTKSFGVPDLRVLSRYSRAERQELRADADPQVLRSTAQLQEWFPDIFINLQEVLCPEGGGAICPAVDVNDQVLAFDGYHLSRAGARYAGPLFDKAGIYDRIMAPRQTGN